MNIFHFKQFDIIQEHAAMKVGTDSDLLGALGAGGKRILDIGTGTGVLTLIMAQRFPDAQLSAVEIDDNAVKDASVNFASSKWADRITLHHIAFQDFIVAEAGKDTAVRYDSIVCNPPYFDKSLECPDLGRSRARHSSSLPFDVLVKGAYQLLDDEGMFSVCLPPEVLTQFKAECLFAGFSVKEEYQIKSVPRKQPKRYIIVFKKGRIEPVKTHLHCMRNADGSRSQWYLELMRDFLVNP